MKKVNILREKGNRFCQLEVKLSDGRLSICGSAGYILNPRQSKVAAFQYWQDYFEYNPEEIIAMNKRCGSSCKDAASAARFVLKVDGPFHGLDVLKRDLDKVYIIESCGQIREELKEYFPEYEKYFRWHLNDMHAECEHQEARGETWGYFSKLEEDIHKQAKERRDSGLPYYSDNWIKSKLAQLEDKKVCKDCGYKLGSAWTKRELPQEVIDWVDSLVRQGN